jgi:alkylhydroperoxidase family enzyme
LTEAITLITDGHVPDAIYEHARKNFSEEELVNLAMAIITINGWNRLSITFRSVPGEYQPGKK